MLIPAFLATISYFFNASGDIPQGTDITATTLNNFPFIPTFARNVSNNMHATFSLTISPSKTGKTIFVFPAVLPISFLASAPTAFNSVLSPIPTAATVCSLKTIPLPALYMLVYRLPKSIAILSVAINHTSNLKQMPFKTAFANLIKEFQDFS